MSNRHVRGFGLRNSTKTTLDTVQWRTEYYYGHPVPKSINQAFGLCFMFLLAFLAYGGEGSVKAIWEYHLANQPNVLTSSRNRDKHGQRTLVICLEFW